MPTSNPFEYRYWPIRVGVGTIMLLLSFAGLVLTYIEPLTSKTSWYYWISMTVIFALLCIGFSWYLRSKDITILSSLWQDILLWLGMLMALFILHSAVSAGFIGRVESGVFLLDMLAFATFCAGIMLDPCFLLVGITLFIFAFVMIVFEKYLAIAVFGIIVVSLVTLYFLARGGSPKKHQ